MFFNIETVNIEIKVNIVNKNLSRYVNEINRN